MDLSEIERNLKEAAARLEAQAAPTRARLEALGPSGLFEIAAAEQLKSDRATDPDARRRHRLAARAAERLAEQMQRA